MLPVPEKRSCSAVPRRGVSFWCDVRVPWHAASSTMKRLQVSPASACSVFMGLMMASSIQSQVRAEEEFSFSTYYRGDTDSTVVVTPRIGANLKIGSATTVDASYSADIWSSASIDIRTAATGRITEQRDQITAAVTHEFLGWTLGASYYFSGENDYLSNGLTLFSTQSAAGGSATFEQSVSFLFDQVGRAGDPNFNENVAMGTGRFVYSQALNPDAIIQVAYEGSYRNGYQASPYRFVGFGGDGLCNGTAVFCLSESHPNTRFRNAAVVDSRIALSDNTSLGLGYRFYIDSWGILSHTGIVQAAWLVSDVTSLTLRYRFYTQGAAYFYQARYLEADADLDYFTRDRENGGLYANRLAVGYERLFDLDRIDAVLRMALAVGGTVLTYRDFVGLDEVYAIDTTLAFTLEL